MRRLARSLLRDASLADDVVQEASLAALRSGRSFEELPRAWWARVVRNVAAKFRRSRRRSDARERSTARREAQPAADEVARRLALHRAIVAAVEGLPPDYRDVVVRRWFDGMKPQRIAVELGVPIATVKTRLRRALARLRSALEQEWGDGVAGMLVALARPRAGWIATAPVATGAILMSAKLKAALAFVVVALASVWVGGQWRSRSIHPRTPPLEVATPAPAIADAAATPVHAPAASRVEQPSRNEPASTAPADPRRLGRITGVVTGPSGPIAGARVELVRRIGEDVNVHSALRDVLPMRRRESTSAADGSFEFAEIPRGVVFAIEASADPDLIGSTPRGVRAGEHVLLSVGKLARLAGVVRRSRGEVVSGATVVASVAGGADALCEQRTTTDSTGRFEIERLAAWPVRVQAFTPAGDLMAPVLADLRAGATTEVELVLSDLFALDGVVTDDRDGHPIGGARIHLEGDGNPGAPVAVSDDSGRFRIATDLEWPGSRLLFVRAQGYGFHEFAAPSPRDPPATVEVRLHRGRAIRGRVVTADGAPIPEAVVAVAFAMDPVGGNLGEDYAQDRSEADGRFVLADVDPRRDHVLLVRSEGFAGTFVSLRGNPNLEDDVDVGDVVARRGALVAGTLVNREGAPVPEGRVVLERVDAAPSSDAAERRRFEFIRMCVGSRSVSTSADGNFAFDGVVPGEWRLRAEGGVPLGNPAVSLTVRGDEIHDGVELSVDEGLSIAGRVVDDRGVAIVGARVIARGEGLAPSPLSRLPVSQAARSASDGTFAIRSLPSGAYRLIAELPASQRKSPRPLARAVAADVPAGGSGVTLVMHDGALICGRVTTRDGSPASDASVKALDDERHPLGEAGCDADGRFDLVVPRLETEAASARVVQRRSVTLAVKGPPRDRFSDATPIGTATLEHVALDGTEVAIELSPSDR